LKADYKSALKQSIALRAKYRNNFDVEYIYAKILGDYADERPKKEQVKMKREASTILRKLCQKLNNKPNDVKFWVRTNYYYQSRQFKKLIKVGLELMAQDKSRGLYSSGGGATLHAEFLVKTGKKRHRKLARRYAKLAVSYWQSYFSLNPKETFYFPYTLYASGHAILGNVQKMEKLLEKSQKLSGKKKDYWEFAEVRDLGKKAEAK
jgi:hypothetical protein